MVITKQQFDALFQKASFVFIPSKGHIIQGKEPPFSVDDFFFPNEQYTFWVSVVGKGKLLKVLEEETLVLLALIT